MKENYIEYDGANIFVAITIIACTVIIGVASMMLYNTHIEIAAYDEELHNIRVTNQLNEKISNRRMKDIDEQKDKEAAAIREEIRREHFKNKRNTIIAAGEALIDEVNTPVSIESNIDETTNINTEPIEEINITPEEEAIKKVRCTGYCNYGVTASGRYVEYGIAAGKREWIGKTAALFEVNDDGTVGDLIKTIEFADTGAGIDTNGDGKGDTLKTGKSIDVWYPSESECYAFSAKYGDYVYMQFI